MLNTAEKYDNSDNKSEKLQEAKKTPSSIPPPSQSQLRTNIAGMRSKISAIFEAAKNADNSNGIK